MSVVKNGLQNSKNLDFLGIWDMFHWAHSGSDAREKHESWHVSFTKKSKNVTKALWSSWATAKAFYGKAVIVVATWELKLLCEIQNRYYEQAS